MKLPRLSRPRENTQRQVVAFGGLNLDEGARDGELRDSFGLSSALFPALSQSMGMKRVEGYAAPSALFARDALCVVDRGELRYGGAVVGQVSWGEKFFASIGPKIVVFPDKVYYDTLSGEFGNLEASVTGTVTFTDSTMTLSDGAWIGLRDGDAVEIAGCVSLPENNKTVIIREVAGTVIVCYENTFAAGAETGVVTALRKVPDLTHVCESNNRLWGVEGQTIYGSALGDPFNFFQYDGLAGDSYAVAVGSAGEFTGVCPFGSHICFFKEDLFYKLFGNKPSNFQTAPVQAPGVQAGSHRSLCMINEALYYKGRGGVYVYTGGLPELISRPLGSGTHAEAAGGGDDARYYLSMRGPSGWGLYVYDVYRRIWLREDDTRISAFATLDGVVYGIRSASVDAPPKFLRSDAGPPGWDIRTPIAAEPASAQKKLSATSASNASVTAGGAVVALGQDDGLREWAAELVPFDEVVGAKKGYSRLTVRIELEEGSWLGIDVCMDGGLWKRVYTTHTAAAKSITVPVQPARCDSFSVRFSGRGRCVVREMTRTFYVGSEA